MLQGESLFQKLGLEIEILSNKEHIDFMLKEPGLVRRPVVRIDGKVYFSANKSVLEDPIQ